MAPQSSRTSVIILALGIAGASAACGSDTVAIPVYPPDDTLDDSGSGSTSSSGSGSGIISQSSTGGTSSSSGGPGSSSGGSSSGSAGGSSSGASTSSSGSSGGGATCNMTGHWLVVQHSVAISDGFKEIGILYLYFDLTQTSEGTIKVNHGLHCGLNVLKDPMNLLGGGDSVSLPSAGPALLARQDEGQAYGSYPARTGTMTPNKAGTGCDFHMNRYYTVRGATIPYYLNPMNSMSTSMPVAMNCGANFSNCQTPGSEDWDGDGNPGFTLSVSGTATGNIYAAQRDFNEFTGTVKFGATKFEVGVVDQSGNVALGPEQYALGYGNGCSGICGLSSMPDTCPTTGGCAAEFFADWVKLDTPPATTNAGICSYVVNNAQTLAPRATDANSAPTEAKYP